MSIADKSGDDKESETAGDVAGTGKTPGAEETSGDEAGADKTSGDQAGDERGIAGAPVGK